MPETRRGSEGGDEEERALTAGVAASTDIVHVGRGRMDGEVDGGDW